MKIGLLPLYIKLYDDNSPAMRPRLEAFYRQVTSRLESEGATVLTAPFCRVKEEFDSVISGFVREGADALMTLHMAYSPSLESIDALASASLPIVVLDTTETRTFGVEQARTEVSYNHGIHGVMDMCSMLRRRGVPFAIAAGHFESSDVVRRAMGYVRAAIAARALGRARVLLFGEPFAGMGDFSVPDEEMKSRLSVTVSRPAPEEVARVAAAVTEREIDAEIARDMARYEKGDGFDLVEYRESVRAKLAVRTILKNEAATAFTCNFNTPTGFPATPFLAASEALAEGIGYAGEGDTLTASLVSALLSAYPETNFTEFFCPDWDTRTLFLSHMGECNLRIAESTPVLTRVKNKYASPTNPYMAAVRMKSGKGVYVNICVQKGGSFKLIVTESEMLDAKGDTFTASVRGWLGVGMSTADFLERYSEAGGTHHGIFLYGATAKEMRFFGALLGMDTVIL